MGECEVALAMSHRISREDFMVVSIFSEGAVRVCVAGEGGIRAGGEGQRDDSVLRSHSTTLSILTFFQ